MYIKIRLFGRSFHPMLVGYPITFFLGSFVAFFVYQLNGELFWFRVGNLANKAGVLVALATMLPGVIGRLAGLGRQTRTGSADWWYWGLSGGALAIYIGTILLCSGRWNQGNPNNLPVLLLTGLGVLLTLTAGFYGWQLLANQYADDANVLRWQVAAEQLEEEVERLRAELAKAQNRSSVTSMHLGDGEQPPSWSHLAGEAWAALAAQAPHAVPMSTSPDSRRLLIAIAATLAALMALLLIPILSGLV